MKPWTGRPFRPLAGLVSCELLGPPVTAGRLRDRRGTSRMGLGADFSFQPWRLQTISEYTRLSSAG
ncbi:MAG: hypothetical protein GY856_54490 [bacterium]|nr:hypothetical protein [bacterium]